MTKIKAAENKACMSVADVAAEMGVSRATVYDLARRADFPAIHLGKRIIVPRSAFYKWLDDCAGRVIS